MDSELFYQLIISYQEELDEENRYLNNLDETEFELMAFETKENLYNILESDVRKFQEKISMTTGLIEQVSNRQKLEIYDLRREIRRVIIRILNIISRLTNSL